MVKIILFVLGLIVLATGFGQVSKSDQAVTVDKLLTEIVELNAAVDKHERRLRRLELYAGSGGSQWEK